MQQAAAYRKRPPSAGGPASARPGYRSAKAPTSIDAVASPIQQEEAFDLAIPGPPPMLAKAASPPPPPSCSPGPPACSPPPILPPRSPDVPRSISPRRRPTAPLPPSLNAKLPISSSATKSKAREVDGVAVPGPPPLPPDRAHSVPGPPPLPPDRVPFVPPPPPLSPFRGGRRSHSRNATVDSLAFSSLSDDSGTDLTSPRASFLDASSASDPHHSRQTTPIAFRNATGFPPKVSGERAGGDVHVSDTSGDSASDAGYWFRPIDPQELVATIKDSSQRFEEMLKEVGTNSLSSSSGEMSVGSAATDDSLRTSKRIRSARDSGSCGSEAAPKDPKKRARRRRISEHKGSPVRGKKKTPPSYRRASERLMCSSRPNNGERGSRRRRLRHRGSRRRSCETLPSQRSSMGAKEEEEEEEPARLGMKRKQCPPRTGGDTTREKSSTMRGMLGRIPSFRKRERRGSLAEDNPDATVPLPEEGTEAVNRRNSLPQGFKPEKFSGLKEEVASEKKSDELAACKADEAPLSGRRKRISRSRSVPGKRKARTLGNSMKSAFTWLRRNSTESQDSANATSPGSAARSGKSSTLDKGGFEALNSALSSSSSMRDLSEAPPRNLSDRAECKSPIETLVASLATGGSSLRGVDFSSLDNRRSGRQSRNVLTPVREMPSKAGDSSAASDVQNSSDANTTASTGGSSPTEDLDGLEAEDPPDAPHEFASPLGKLFGPVRKKQVPS